VSDTQPQFPVVFSVGHSSLKEQAFFGLLQTHAITDIVDVRSQPHSRFAPQFNAGMLEMSCDVAGVDYVFLGDTLGGRPRERRFYDGSGRVDYSALARSPSFKRGLDRLITNARTSRVAILCSEEDPRGCHRRLLIGPELIRRGVGVVHIRSDGRIETEDELRASETAVVQRQLFGEDSAWKSIRSVSRAGPHRISSRS
jgi:uncharacterized protein (DUF488 family)